MGKVNNSRVANTLISLLNPFLGAVVVSRKVFSEESKKSDCLIFSFSVALILVYQPIFYDTSSNFFKYQQSLNGEYLNLYNLIPFYLNYFAGIDYIYTYFAYVWFVSYVFFALPTTVLNKNKRSVIYLVSILVVLNFSPREILDLNRNLLSISLFSYTLLTSKEVHNNKFLTILKKLIFFTVSILIHSSSLILVILYLVAKKSNRLLIIFTYIICCLIALFYDDFIYKLASTLIDGGINVQLDYFSDETKFGGGNDARSFILYRFITLSIIIISAASIIIRKRKLERITTSVLLLGAICILFLSYKTLYERTVLMYLFLLPFILLKSNVRHSVLLVLGALMFSKFLLVNFIQFGHIYTTDYENIFPNSDVKYSYILKPFYTPTPVLVILSEYGYSDEVIVKNLFRGK